MSVEFSLEYDDLKAFEEAVKAYPGNAEKKINKYLHGKGYSIFEKAIKNAMPVSGRTWKGKKNAAKTSNSIEDKNKDDNLSVTLHPPTRYNYLYFPNDGTNTERHIGNQRFFERGVEQESNQAINDMLDLLKFEKE